MEHPPPLIDRTRATRLLSDAGIDLLLASRRENVAYLSGVFSHLYWEYPEVAHCLEREDDGCDSPYYFVGLPADPGGTPFVVAHNNRAGLWTQGSWITDVRACCGREHGQSAIDHLVRVVTERGLERGRIGLEYRHLPISIFLELHRRLPHVVFIDSAALFWTLRMVKTPEELTRQREAYRIGETVYTRVLDALRDNPRRHVQELRGIEMAVATEAGCPPLHFGYLFPQDNQTKRAWASDAGTYMTEPGETILLDLGLIWRGYTTDFGRVATLGPASPMVRDAYERLRELRSVIEAAIRPGERACDVWRAASDFQKRRGQRLGDCVGHSLGIECHEAPRFAPEDRTTLEPGMTMVIELVGGVERIAFLLEDAGVITEHGWESLTTFGTELIEITV